MSTHLHGLRRTLLPVLLVCLALVLLVRRPLGPQRVELGAPADVAFVAGDWARGQRLDIDPPAASDGVLAFYYRPVRTGAALDLPFEARGPLALTLRAKARVRSLVTVVVDGRTAGQVLVSTARWERLTADLGAAGGWRSLALAFGLRPFARTRGAHALAPEVMADWIELHAPEGLRLSWPAALVLGAVPLALLLCAHGVGLSARASLLTAGVGALALGLLARHAPLAAVAAVPRLLPVALLAGVLVFLALRRTALPPFDRRALAGLVAAGTLAHGALVFLPNHNPPDLETHVGRTLDFAAVPLDYHALLRYGSHLPTATQTAAPATDLFGVQALVPYAPLPYFIYYAAARLGLGLHWLMTALNAALAMALCVALWLAARAVWDRGAAWLAALLLTLDLALWHHLGRAHAPATFGQVLASTALLFLLARAEHVDTRRRVLAAGALLALGVLGYTSLVVLVGLFGAALVVLVTFDARGLPVAARRGLALALVVGGVLALAAYYGHYVPGFLRGGGAQAVEAEPEIFTGRVVLGIFRNEGRQSHRIWVLGFALPLVAGLAAAPFALRRARAGARPVLLAWLAAWVLVMVLKDPALFPKTLRWAKEDQFVSPLLCLLIAGGVGALPRAWMRWAAAAVVLGTAAFLQQRDFLLHADTLLW